MRNVIITFRSLLWFLTSLVATLLMFSALLSPTWLVASSKSVPVKKNETFTYVPSVGVYARCGKPLREMGYRTPNCHTLALHGLATDPEVFPNVWKAATFFIASGITIMSLTVITGIVSCCHQSLFKKSIFTISGATQAVAGICFITGVMLHPMGWGSSRVQMLCGHDASPFYPDKCSLGSGLYTAVLSTLLTMTAACLSVPAEKSTSSDKVQDQIDTGQTLICLP